MKITKKILSQNEFWDLFVEYDSIFCILLLIIIPSEISRLIISSWNSFNSRTNRQINMVQNNRTLLSILNSKCLAYYIGYLINT